MDASEPQMIELESEVMRESTHGMAASDSSVIFPILSPLIFFLKSSFHILFPQIIFRILLIQIIFWESFILRVLGLKNSLFK